MAYINGSGSGIGGWPAVLDSGPRPGSVAPPVADPHATGWRNQTIQRLIALNARHGLAAYDRRGTSDALGPHAVAFLYQPRPSQTPAGVPTRVLAATRLFLSSDEVTDLPALLGGLADIAKQHLDGGGFDPLTMVNSRDDDLTPQAWYLGVAVSCLDTPAGPWATIQHDVAGAMQVPGQCWAMLTDGTRLVVDRGGDTTLRVASSQQLDATPGLGVWRWTWLPPAQGHPQRQVWHQLARLHWSAIETQRRQPR